VLGAAAGLLLSRALGPEWSAGATVSFSSVSADPLLFGNPNASLTERDTADAAALAVSQSVLEPASALLGTGTPWDELQRSVTVTPQPGSSILTLEATAADGPDAAARLLAVTNSLEEVLRQRVVEAASSTATAAAAAAAAAPEGQQGALSEIAARARVVAATADPVQVLTTEAPQQVRPAPVRDAATGAVLGLLLAAAALVLVRVRPAKVTNGRDAGELLGLPAGQLRTGEAGDETVALVDDLRRLAHQSLQPCLVVIPAGAGGAAAAQEVAALLTGSADQVVGKQRAGAGERTAATPRVVITGDPLTSVVEPSVRHAGAVVLAVETGTSSRTLRAVHHLTAAWEHRPDAVIVAE
jgi:capsular polysaccharide biosynthesis protein